MVAIVLSEESQVTEVVKFSVLPSDRIPVAVNCCVPPLVILADAGVTSIDSNTAGVTVSVVVPETLPNVALIVVVPTPAEVASPLEPAVLLMVETRPFEELQETDDVIFCVVVSENVPVAINC